MKFLILLAFVALSRANETDDIKLAADNPQKLQALFSQFRRDNHRVYKNPLEARMRMGIFRNFVKGAAKVNAEQDDITVGVTFFADLTEEEKMMYHGANTTQAPAPELEAPAPEAPAKLTSANHKHRYGAVKNQGQCGSCWTFASVGLVEGYQSMLTGRYSALSEKMVLDCSNCGSCSGGYTESAMRWIQRNNRLASGSSYRYRASKGRCESSRHSNAMQIRVTGVYRGSGSSGMASALNRGPVIFLLYNFHGVAIEGYKSGVLKEEHFGPRASNHVVVGIGYTSSQWQMRNSWGSWWGQGGYFSKSRGDRMVANYVTYMAGSRAGQEEKEE